MTITNGEYTISTEKEKLDIPFIHQNLAHSYWAEGIPEDTIKKCVEGSICFGLYTGDRQIGFARLITDSASFAYLADVFIDEEFRGQGMGKWMMKVIMEHKSVQGLRRFMLATKDAHGLYRQFGFSELTFTERWMHIHNPDVYKEGKQ